MLFDTHAHYDDEQFECDRETLLGGMQQAGIGTIVNVGSDVASWQDVRRLTKQYPFVYGAAGLHPDAVGEMDENQFACLRQILTEDKMLAVGEIGLDYYWDKQGHDIQKKWFVRQLELALEMQLPVIIHSREAAEDTMQIMRAYAGKLDGVIHCFSYSPEVAKEYVKMGFYIGVGGVITFQNARKLKEAVKEIPLEQIVLETDCPYLAPVPNRGKRNSSLNLIYIAEQIASLKQVSVETVTEQTEKNAKKLYRLES